MLKLLYTVGVFGAPELDDKTFDAAINSGKGAFIKFLAPWWGHCKNMKPAWDQLADEFKASNNVAVYDVDCTAAGKTLCSTVGVRGYPTIKYYLADNPKPQDYKGGRDFAGLKSFVEKTFKAGCVPSTKENCSESQKTLIDELNKKSKDEILKYAKSVKEEIETKKKERLQRIKDEAKLMKEWEQKEEDLAVRQRMAEKLAGGDKQKDEL